MERWAGKVAVVTRADLDIGGNCCKQLVELGMIVVAVARHTKRVDAFRACLKRNTLNLHCIELISIHNKQEVRNAFVEIEEKFGTISVFVYICIPQKLFALNDVRTVPDVNVLGVACCTKEAFRLMKRNNSEAQVLLVNAVRVTHNSQAYMSIAHAMKAIKEFYHCEFEDKRKDVKINIINPVLLSNDIQSEYCSTTTIKRLCVSNVVKSIVDALIAQN